MLTNMDKINKFGKNGKIKYFNLFNNKIISKIFIDTADGNEVAKIEELGVEAIVTNTVMLTEKEKMGLGNKILSETGIEF